MYSMKFEFVFFPLYNFHRKIIMTKWFKVKQFNFHYFQCIDYHMQALKEF